METDGVVNKHKSGAESEVPFFPSPSKLTHSSPCIDRGFLLL
ncbi:hypothetical protein SynBIOSE41_01666 [Synechococcus sp. BIOS-E4-1]|nr:hypothetical protein SynBIOSE41_01666 [Synechococcus sp. BIOS-E4-1]